MTSAAYGIAMPVSRGILGHPVPLLLDLISATPTLALATWKLRQLYNGPCLRVIRPDTTQQDFGFVNGVLDPGLAAWVGAGNDGFVTRIYDQSTLNHYWSTSTVAQRPKIVSAGTLITDIAGLPTLRFDGVANTLTSGYVTSTYLTANNYGLMCLSRPTAGVGYDTQGWTIGGVISAGGGRNWWHGFGPTKFSGGHYNTADISARVAMTYPATVISAHSYDGATVKSWINGGASTNNVDNRGIAALTDSVWLGGSGTFAGAFAAGLVFNVTPSLADLNIIGANWVALSGDLAWTTAT